MCRYAWLAPLVSCVVCLSCGRGLFVEAVCRYRSTTFGSH